MIDYHCHLLPALDDGASDLAESMEMARILADFGFSTVHCTPHLIKGCYENDPAKVARATQTMQGMLQEAGIPLQLVPGTEHYLDEFLPQLLPGALTFGRASALLLELPARGGTGLLQVMVSQLVSQGKQPLIAHPERCSAFQPAADHKTGRRNPLGFLFKKRAEEAAPGDRLMQRLQKSGCRFQGNIGSFAGVYGREVKERALTFLRQGCYSCLGSDAHRARGLAETLAAGYRVIVSEIGEAAAQELFNPDGVTADVGWAVPTKSRAN